MGEREREESQLLSRSRSAGSSFPLFLDKVQCEVLAGHVCWHCSCWAAAQNSVIAIRVYCLLYLGKTP